MYSLSGARGEKTKRERSSRQVSERDGVSGAAGFGGRGGARSIYALGNSNRPAPLIYTTLQYTRMCNFDVQLNCLFIGMLNRNQSYMHCALGLEVNL